MRDGRLIIILIVTYNIRCIGAISFTCVHGIRRYIFSDQLFSRATMRDHSGRGSASHFFIYFYFPSGKIEYITYVSRNIGVTVIRNEEFCHVVNMLKFFRIEHGSISFARQQKRSIIHQWTMFGTDCNGPQLAASVSLFIQFSLVLHLFLFRPSSSKCIYMFFRRTYFSCYCSMMYCHIF